MIGHIEFHVVHPDGVAKSGRDFPNPLAVAGHMGDALCDQGNKSVVVETPLGHVEDHHGPNVHRGGRILQLEEGRIE